jgi:hypothetical protein
MDPIISHCLASQNFFGDEIFSVAEKSATGGYNISRPTAYGTPRIQHGED